MLNGVLLVTALAIELLITYSIEKNIVSPGFIFNAVFLLASLNLLTNINSYQVSLSFNTCLIVVIGVACFWLGTIFVKKVRISISFHVKLSTKSRITQEEINIPNSVLAILTVFNIITTIYVGREVVALTRQFGFTGTNLSAIGRYRELGLAYGARMQLGTIPTLLTALAEANGYVLGCILADNFANGNYRAKRNSLWIILAFLSSFISTFSQGSRGGIYMILTSVFLYLLNLYSTGRLIINFKSIIRTIILIALILVAFQYSAILFNKVWKVSFYEYLSVYLGDPIINLNTYIDEGIPRAPLWGYFSFKPIFVNISSKIGYDYPIFSLGGFRFLNGHNLGNVYTIFSYLLADFGLIGSYIYLMFIGLISQVFYNNLAGHENDVIVSKIIYGYMLTSIAFSFFSNKVGENLSFYHMYVWLFEYLYIIIFKLRWKRRSINSLEMG